MAVNSRVRYSMVANSNNAHSNRYLRRVGRRLTSIHLVSPTLSHIRVWPNACWVWSLWCHAVVIYEPHWLVAWHRQCDIPRPWDPVGAWAMYSPLPIQRNHCPYTATWRTHRFQAANAHVTPCVVTTCQGVGTFTIPATDSQSWWVKLLPEDVLKWWGGGVIIYVTTVMTSLITGLLLSYVVEWHKIDKLIEINWFNHFVMIIWVIVFLTRLFGVFGS